MIWAFSANYYEMGIAKKVYIAVTDFDAFIQASADKKVFAYFEGDNTPFVIDKGDLKDLQFLAASK